MDIGNSTSAGSFGWLSEYWLIIVVVVIVLAMGLYYYFRGRGAKKQVIPASKPAPQPQIKPQAATQPPQQPAPTVKQGVGVGVYNGSPISIIRDGGKQGAWAVQELKYKSYAQNSEEINRAASLLGAKLRDFGNLKALLAASREARDVLVKANVPELESLIQQLNSSIGNYEKEEQ